MHMYYSIYPSIKTQKLRLSGLFDQIIHSTENVDIIGLFKHLHPKVIVPVPFYFTSHLNGSVWVILYL